MTKKEDSLLKHEQLTQKYLEAMQQAANGGTLDMDAAGLEALRKITAQTGALVPSVTEIDDSGRGIGYDLFSRLLKDRIVLLNGPVNEAMAAVACASLLFLDSIGEDGRAVGKGDHPDITVYIDSPGGSVLAGRAIYDAMRNVESKVTTIGVGMQASMGSVLLAGGDERMMTPGSKLMIHSLSSGTQGTYATQVISLDFSGRLFDELKSIYVAHIGLTPEYWDLCCAQDTWLTPDQAKKMGFIHDILKNEGKKAPYQGAADAFLKANQDAREAKVAGLSKEELIALLTVSGRSGKLGETHRPEILVALSQMPDFWTEGKKAEMLANGVSNDNAPVVTKKNKAPKAE